MDTFLVDDCRTIILHLRKLLERKHGITVTAYDDPFAALIEGRMRAVDLVLVDQHMPRMEGVAFIREISAVPHYAQVPIVMITSDVCDAMRLNALEAGATDFLDKRTEGIELSVRLRNLAWLASAVRRLDEQASSLAYVVKKGHDCMAVEHEMWGLLDKREAEYPAEHNVGHFYYAKPELAGFYQKLDPTNSLNPGIGHTKSG